MLNVSATQALLKRIKQLETEKASLKENQKNITARLEKIEKALYIDIAEN